MAWGSISDALSLQFFGDKWGTCAKEGSNGQWQICNHECGNITASQGVAWNAGKRAALAAATKYVGDGPFFANGPEAAIGVQSNLNGHWNTRGSRLLAGDPRDLIADVRRHLQNHSYFYDSCTDDQVSQLVHDLSFLVISR